MNGERNRLGRGRARRRWRRTSLALAGLLLGSSAAVALAGPAHADVYCNGASCEGRDPSAMGCGTDAYAVNVVFVDRLGQMEGLELRYSPACNANWARLSARAYYGAWVSMCVVNDANRNNIQCTGSFRNTYKWSPMIDGNKRVFASVGYSLDSGGSGNARTGAF